MQIAALIKSNALHYDSSKKEVTNAMNTLSQLEEKVGRMKEENVWDLALGMEPEKIEGYKELEKSFDNSKKNLDKLVTKESEQKDMIDMLIDQYDKLEAERKAAEPEDTGVDKPGDSGDSPVDGGGEAPPAPDTDADDEATKKIKRNNEEKGESYSALEIVLQRLTSVVIGSTKAVVGLYSAFLKIFLSR